MKIKLALVMMVLLVGMITYHPVVASGVVTTCDEASLVSALAGGGVVDFNIGTDCEIVFTSEKVISVNTTIQNTSGRQIIFTGDYYTPIDTRLFTVNSGVSLTLDNLTLQNGKALFGGAIYNDGGNLTVMNSFFLDNQATGDPLGISSGGAIYQPATGNLTIMNSFFFNNQADEFSGAIDVAYGNVTITDSIFHSNTASDGGAIHIADAQTELSGNLFESNHGAMTGAVLYTVNSGTNQINISNNTFLNHQDYTYTTLFLSLNAGIDLNFSVKGNRFINNTSLTAPCGVLTLQDVLSQGELNGDVINNTFVGNISPANGATVCAGDDANQTVNFMHNTFHDNTNNLIVYGFGDFVLSANIFDGGGCLTDLGGAYTDGGNNIAYNAPGCVGANVDPQLNPMFSYAFVPALTSPAVNAYSAPCAVSDDQFGTARPMGGMCDIGAIEGSASPNTTVTSCSESALNLALAGGGTVDFNIGADCTIPFTFEKIIGTNTTVQNTSPFYVVFEGGNKVGLFTINNGANLTLNNLGLSRGYSLLGGGVFNDESTLNLINVDFYYNTTMMDINFGSSLNWSQGGAVYSFGEATTTITETNFSSNRATFGGAISMQPRWDDVTSQYYYGEMTITDSIFDSNWAVNSGAIAANGTLTLDGNRFEWNVADVAAAVQYLGTDSTESVTVTNNLFKNHFSFYFGGVLAIWASNGQTNFSVSGNSFIDNSTSNAFVRCSALTLYDEPGGAQLIGDVTNNTFSENNNVTSGDVVCISDDDGIINLTHNTFADSNAPSGGNLNVRFGTVTAKGNIFQDGGCTVDMGGQIADGGNNIVYNATNCVGANVNPQLGSLTPQFVHIPTNTAIEYAPACHIAVDQIGENRPVGALCTPGSVEIIGGPVQTITVEFASASGNASENSNIGNVLRVTTDDSSPTDFVATVNVLVNNITTDIDDYNLSGTVTIPAGTPHNTLISIDGAITIVDDAVDEVNESFQLTLTAPSGAILGTQTTYTHTINDNDTAGYSLNTTSVTNISEPNTATTFTIKLTSQPVGTVILDFGTTDNTECVASLTTFTFNNTNWNGDQTITITAQDDAIVDGAQACAVTISRNASSTASEYGSVANPSNVSVQVADDDVPIVERNLILSENELLAVLQSQAPSDTQFFIVDITPTTITIVMRYLGEYGQVILTVNDADFTRFVITSVTNLTGGSVSGAFSEYAYQELINLMMVGLDEWIEDAVAPATSVIKAITIMADVITITMDVSN